MNSNAVFPVAGKVKVLRGEQEIYQGTVANIFSYGGANAMKIELGNRTELTFLFFKKLNGEEGWILMPEPLPAKYTISQEAMLSSIQMIN